MFSSIGAGDFAADAKTRGTRMLREFLHYAETGKIAAGNVTGADFDSPFEEAVALAIRKAGYRVAPQVGVSGFRVDLVVLDPEQSGRFVLGVECDGATYQAGGQRATVIAFVTRCSKVSVGDCIVFGVATGFAIQAEKRIAYWWRSRPLVRNLRRGTIPRVQDKM